MEKAFSYFKTKLALLLFAAHTRSLGSKRTKVSLTSVLPLDAQRYVAQVTFLKHCFIWNISMLTRTHSLEIIKQKHQKHAHFNVYRYQTRTRVCFRVQLSGYETTVACCGRYETALTNCTRSSAKA